MEKGIKETTEALEAMGALAVVARKSYREAGGDMKKFVTTFGMNIVADPAAMSAVKEGFDGAGEIPGELKDLSFTEVLSLGENAIRITRNSFISVQP